VSEATLGIPAPGRGHVQVRFASLLDRDAFDRPGWRHEDLGPGQDEGWFELNLDTLGLPDGDYEYEFVLDGDEANPVADPYARVLTRFGGYRGIFTVKAGEVTMLPAFSWEDEMSPGRPLPRNDEIVIYETPVRWMTGEGGEEYPGIRQVGLGTFDRLLFERLNALVELGVNAIELMPVQDSADTLNWGYGTRFLFAPDFDMGSPTDLRCLIKACHQQGIRVLLDVVMNHSRACPLEVLAHEWYYLNPDEEPGRNGWGGERFRYAQPRPNDAYLARELQFRMAQFWIEAYHIDGFRIDAFADIDDWDFVQGFRDRAWQAQQATFPDRPLLVVVEDSWRRAVLTQAAPPNPGGRRTADAEWNFSYQEDVRLLLLDRLGAPRRARLEAAISGSGVWDGMGSALRPGFTDLAQAVDYLTSHDVQQPEAQRLMSVMVQEEFALGAGQGSVAAVRDIVDGVGTRPDPPAAYTAALDRVRGAFSLLLTSVGIPMLLAGEEFGDVHDVDPADWRLKMSDPVDWQRRWYPRHGELRDRIRNLILLRRTHPALQRDEIDFFYYHPAFEADPGERVFAYCRTRGMELGAPGQVVVVANCGPIDYAGGFDLPWHWEADGLVERAPPLRGNIGLVKLDGERATLMLAPFEVRVFASPVP
jgi:1,4-alpha-glucan branching enzyme